MKIKAFILTFFVALVPLVTVMGQAGAMKRGDKYYQQGVWIKAIPYYERYLKRNDDSNVAEHLGDCYRRIGEPANALKAYEKAVKAENPSPEAMLKFGKVLHLHGRYEDARDAYLRYQKMAENPSKVEKYIAALDQVPLLKKDSLKYSIISLPNLNSPYSEIMPVKYRQGILFASNRPRRLFNGGVDLDTDKPFFDLYYSAGSGINFVEPILLPGKINSKFHDGPAVIGPDSTMYITLSNYQKGRFTQNTSSENHLVIFTARRIGKEWVLEEPMPFNSDEFTAGHAAISPNGRIMVFATNRPGGFGLSDLWMVKREGVFWSEPSNLGARINTDGDEYFPSFGEDNTLYYSSDGIGGLGGLDLYSSKYVNGAFQNPENLGYPINSSKDDFGLLLDKEFGGGYFSSNRPGSQDDDIYAFKVKSGLKGTVVNARTGDPIENANVEVVDENGAVFPFTTDAEGSFFHPCKPNAAFLIKTNMAGFLENKLKVSTSGLTMGEDKKVEIRISKENIFAVSGTVKDKTTLLPIPNPKVELIRSDGVKNVVTGEEDGSFSMKLEPNFEYNLIISKAGYVPEVHRISTEENEAETGFVINALLEKGDYAMVEGRVITLDRGAPMEGVALTVLDNQNSNPVSNLKSGKGGLFYIALPFERLTDYSIMAAKQGYFSTRVDVEREGDGSKKAIIRMKLVEYGLEKIVKVIYYDYNSSALSAYSRKDLNEIYYFLQENPEATIELGSHTDSRGSKSYNLNLSQRRSDAVVRYFVERMGVAPNRIISKGYGEEFLVNDCDDYKKCTEEGHGYNRRSEIKVVQLRPVE